MKTSWIVVLALIAIAAVSASLVAVMLLPDTEPSNQPEPAAVPDTDDQSEPAAVPDTDDQSEPAAVPDTDDQSEPAAVPDTDDQSEPAAVPDTDDQSEPAAVPDTDDQSEPAAVPDTDDQSEPTTVPDTDDQLEPTTVPDTDDQLEPTTVPDTDDQLEPTTVPDTDDQLEPTTVPDTDDQLEPTTVPDTDDQLEPTTVPYSIAMANNDFTIDFYRKISNNTDNHFFSPTSMFIAFSALYEGARQNTAEQMEQVFGFEPDGASRLNTIYSFMSSLNRESEHFTLEMGNAIWLAEWLKLSQSYNDIVRNIYLADIEIVDFVGDGMERINGWASEKTHEKIKKVLSPGDVDGSTAMAITNAIYFKGTWVTPFPENDTAESDFWKDSSNSTRTDFMNVFGTFNYTAADGVQVLEMPYKGDRLSMLVILPDDRDGISRVEDMLSADLIEQWRHELEPTNVNVTMPKFKMETKYDLIGPLTGLGMPDVFNAAKADLSGIGKVLKPGFEGRNMYVTKALQKAYVDVNEEGTEAAAVTVIVIGIVSVPPPPPIFTADHPFIFMIVDNESGTILFMGRMSDPTA